MARGGSPNKAGVLLLQVKCRKCTSKYRIQNLIRDESMKKEYLKHLGDLISRAEKERSSQPTLDTFMKRNPPTEVNTEEDIEMEETTSNLQTENNKDIKAPETPSENKLLKENAELKKKVSMLMEENGNLRKEMDKLKEDMRNMIQEEIQKALKIHVPTATKAEEIKNEPAKNTWSKAVTRVRSYAALRSNSTFLNFSLWLSSAQA